MTTTIVNQVISEIWPVQNKKRRFSGEKSNIHPNWVMRAYEAMSHNFPARLFH
ncbi:MAG: hypothetical protein ACYCUZ_01005 [Cuniculiplasma sp.]